ncbi:MAG: hypothetical protein LUE27_08275 [Clostridia bacterium]|nr:hypothetical protein [Clostridia bacterium]
MSPFELVYSKENLDGMKRLFEYSQKKGPAPNGGILLLMIQTIVDEACADQISAEEMERRIRELNGGLKENKYYAVMSGLERSTPRSAALWTVTRASL